jgi:hypothetical protein
MREFRKANTTWELCVGSVLAVIGILLIGFAGWKMLDLWISTTIYVAGSIACLGGFFLIWKDLLEAAAFPDESLPRSEGNFLGRFRLNGYSFEAYEQKGENGRKQFRLVSSPKVSPEREAACIRYIVNEGLIEDLWPQRSKKIKEEADWAFLP